MKTVYYTQHRGGGSIFKVTYNDAQMPDNRWTIQEPLRQRYGGTQTGWTPAIRLEDVANQFRACPVYRVKKERKFFDVGSLRTVWNRPAPAGWAMVDGGVQ